MKLKNNGKVTKLNKIDYYLSEIDIVSKSNFIEDDIDEYLYEKCNVTNKKERIDKTKEIMLTLIEGGIIDNDEY